MSGPLTGLRVLDLSRILAGPYCTMVLADMGADVVKVEQPGTGDDTRRWGPPFAGDQSTYYLAINRGKRSLTLNLKHPEARQIVLRLVRESDVVIENFKAGDLDRLGLGYERLKELNPRLVHCSISGYGSDGPYADRPGYDVIAQGMGGVMSVTGEPDGPPLKFGLAFSDLSTGLFACVSILAALRNRDLTGKGQHVEVSLLESTVALLINVSATYLNTGVIYPRYGNAHPNIVPYQTFQAADKWFLIACGNDGQFGRLCQLVDRPELASDARFVTNAGRVAHRQELQDELQAAFSTREAAYWIDGLLAAGVPAGPVNDVADVFDDTQVLHRHMLMELPHPTLGSVRLGGMPYKFADTPAEARRHPPLLGEHTEELLREYLGLSPETIQRLRDEGAI
ncbi:MAG: CoA transferase [Chloroflexi bacterium]|nr:CoA transferase [Chloroflexota bacterium]